MFKGYLAFLSCFIGVNCFAYNLDQFYDDLALPLTNTPTRPYLVTGASLTALLILNREGVVEPFQDDYASKKPMGDHSHFGDLMGQLVPNLLYMGGMYAHYKMTNSQRSWQRIEHMFKTTAYAGGVTTVLKRIVNQQRPDKGDRLSFPSGHTTTAFAFASVVGTQHEWYWGAMAYSLASFVGMSRINDNVHYLHDVFAGATIGISYGLAFYYRDYAQVKSNAQMLMLPVNDGLYASYSFSY
jgi:hypothetical protein